MRFSILIGALVILAVVISAGYGADIVSPSATGFQMGAGPVMPEVTKLPLGPGPAMPQPGEQKGYYSIQSSPTGSVTFDGRYVGTCLLYTSPSPRD